MIGQILGHYRLVEKIGAGGMGVVYRAQDERLDRDVAIKVLPVEMLADALAVKSFREEARALSKLNHPNIATIHDFDKQDEVTFLVMEYIPGVTLDRKLTAGPLVEKEVIRLGLQLALGLQAAHSKGVVHRDLKPSNLRVTPDSRLKILDFGLARLLILADPDATRSTLEAHPVAGTLPYMSPEQVRGEPADERSDVYSFGAVLYEMATGQRLFPDRNGSRLIDAILHQTPRPPRELNSQISSGMQSIIQKAVDKEAEHRYQSAKELQVDLERLSMGSAARQSVPMSEPSGPLAVEIAHVLFMEITAYSKLTIDQQRQRIEELQKTVRGTPEFSRGKSADKLISLPSGDGMALVFFDDPEAPCRCAIEVSRTLRNNSETKLRMGIHSGTVYRASENNDSHNVAGDGINVAQRVMHCGDAGHILLSKAVADVLPQTKRWDGALHDLGEAEVKHGVRVHLFSLYNDEVGNPKAPKKLATKAPHKSDSDRHRTPRPTPVKQDGNLQTGSGVEGQKFAPQAKVAETPTLPTERKGFFGRVVRKRFALAVLAALLLGAGAIVASSAFNWNLFVPSSTPKNLPKGIPSLADGKYLAVLPFSVKGDPTILDPVAEGLSQELSAKLLAVRGVWVTSARAAESVDLRGNPVTIAGSLGVNLMISGMVQGDDSKIQITVNLDDVAGGRNRFRQKFPGTKKDLLNVENQIYTQILKALELNPSDEEMERAEAPPTRDPDAYEFYNKGRNAYRGHPDVNQIKTAIGFYEQALARAGNFPLAYASLADASLAMYRETHDSIWIDKAMCAAGLAQKLDDNVEEVHLSLSRVYMETGKTEDAVKELKRALQLSPSDECYRQLGRVYVEAGQRDLAIRSLQNAVTLNRFYWSNENELGLAYFQFGDYANALTAFRRVVDLDPTNPIGHQNIGAVYFQQGKYQESIPEFERAIALQTSKPGVFSDLGLAYLFLGRYDEGVRKLETAAEMSPNDETIIGNLADGYRWSKQPKKAKETYDRAISLANKELEVNPRDASTLGSLAMYHAKTGHAALADYSIRQAQLIDASDPQLVYTEAVVRVLANKPEAAIESLRMAMDKGISPEQASLDPEFNSLHGNRDFEKLLQEAREKLK